MDTIKHDIGYTLTFSYNYIKPLINCYNSHISIVIWLFILRVIYLNLMILHTTYEIQLLKLHLDSSI